MKFRYYITDLFAGTVEGTNDSGLADNLSRSEDYFVVDSETGEWLGTDGTRRSVLDAEST